MNIVPFLKTVENRYGKYSRYVLGHRHFAEGRDGLKPVQRRALWTMKELGLVDEAHLSVTSKISGMTQGNYHPHEDGSVSTAIANMCQVSLSTPLVMGVGAWGDHDQPPGAPRYTKAYLSPYALTMFDADELACIPMDPNFDGTCKEPRFLPAKIPHLLIGGCESLAPGYKGNIPPCPPDWVAEAIQAIIHNKRITPPIRFDYRWGGKLLSLEDTWLNTGLGSAEFTPTFKLENNNVIMTSLAPRLSLESVETRLQDDPAFAGLVEESPNGEIVRILIHVKRGNDAKEFLKRIRAKCITKSHYSFLQIRQEYIEHDVDYYPKIEGPAKFLAYWLDWRKTIVIGAAKNRNANLQKDIAKIDLMLLVINNRRELLKILDQSKTRDDIKSRVINLLKCSAAQATEVMAIPWTRLARLEVTPLQQQRDTCIKNIKANDLIISKPIPRLLSDINHAVEAANLAIVEATKLQDVTKKPKKRGSRI